MTILKLSEALIGENFLLKSVFILPGCNEKEVVTSPWYLFTKHSIVFPRINYTWKREIVSMVLLTEEVEVHGYFGSYLIVKLAAKTKNSCSYAHLQNFN